MATTAAIAARCCNPKMSAVSYRLSTIIFHSGTNYHDLVRLSKFGICMHPQSIVSFEEKLGEKCNAKVQFWKKNIEGNKSAVLLLQETLQKQVCFTWSSYD